MTNSNKHTILVSDNYSFEILAEYPSYSNETSKVFSQLSSTFRNYLKSQTNLTNQMFKKTISSRNLIEAATLSMKPFFDTKKLTSFYIQTIAYTFFILEGSLNNFYDLNLASTFYAQDVLIKAIEAQLTPLDFRISVIQQDISKTYDESPEESLNNLFFKDTSNPSNEIESRLFEILDEVRKISKDNADILKQINDSHTDDISDKKYDDSHNSTPFYKSYQWYKEQIFSAFIGIIVSKIYDLTLGVNPHNTLGFVLLFTCLLAFIRRDTTDK